MIARGVRLACVGLLVSSAAAGDEYELALDPGATEIAFRLGATLHTVEGTARLEGGTILFDPEAGTASGEIVVDARSLATGNARRDRVMHRRVLESEAFPEITFLPERFEGSLADGGTSEARLHGELRLHGAVHPTAIDARIEALEDKLSVTARLSVPYVALGLEDPSKLLLRVAKEAEIEIRFTAPIRRREGSDGDRGPHRPAPHEEETERRSAAPRQPLRPSGGPARPVVSPSVLDGRAVDSGDPRLAWWGKTGLEPEPYTRVT